MRNTSRVTNQSYKPELKSILINKLLRLTKNQELPEIVRSEFESDYKMFLYTLTTHQLIQSVEYETSIINLL